MHQPLPVQIGQRAGEREAELDAFVQRQTAAVTLLGGERARFVGLRI